MLTVYVLLGKHVCFKFELVLKNTGGLLNWRISSSNAFKLYKSGGIVALRYLAVAALTKNVLKPNN